MSVIDFPDNPTTGQTHTSAGVTWVWDGGRWLIVGTTVAPAVPIAGRFASPDASLAAGTWNVIEFSLARVNSGGFVISGGDIIVPEAGIYAVDFRYHGQGAASFVVSMSDVDAPGIGSVASWWHDGNNTSPGSVMAFGTRYLQLAAGAVISLSVFNRGATITASFEVNVAKVGGPQGPQGPQGIPGPFRLLGRATQTTNVTSTGAWADVPGATITFQREVGRTYLFQFSANLVTTVANDIGYLALTNAANTIITDGGGTLIPNPAFGNRAQGFIHNEGATGPVTIKLRTQRLAGTGTLTVNNGLIIVTDMGPTP